MAIAGALCFGLVIGWVTYRTLRRREGAAALSDIATVIGAVGGAAVTTLFDDDRLFGAYSIGLAIGFFAYFVIGLKVWGKDSAGTWMGD
jgi:uncharacterized membrane protein YeaQ/YmgE (transglycosylase-associated protein family)